MKSPVALLLFLIGAQLSTTGLACSQGTCAWQPLGGGVSASIFSQVNTLVSFDDGAGPALYVGGWFTAAGGVPAQYIARWNGTGWASLGSGVSGNVKALAVYDDGTGAAVYAGGSFTSAGGLTAEGVARWDGSSWSAVGGGVSSPGSGSVGNVNALEVFDDGTGPALYVGGVFTEAGGLPVANIAKWDGIAWADVAGGVSGASSPLIASLAVYDDGTGPGLCVAGRFDAAGGSPASCIARWDGLSWAEVGGGVSTSSTSDLPVAALAVFDDGSGPALHVGGKFAAAGGQSIASIAKWDGNAWSALTGLFPSEISALEVYDDGIGPALFAGGSFMFGSGILRWNGASWSSLGSGVTNPSLPGGVVYALEVFDGGGGPSLCAGGRFLDAGGGTANNIAAWSCGSGISITWSQPGGAGGPVHLNNANLTPGHEYMNLFSLDLCSSGAGTGPYLGICATNPFNINFLIMQALTPLGTPVTHFSAPSSYVSWGPLGLPPLTADAITLDLTGGALGSISPVTRIAIQ